MKIKSFVLSLVMLMLCQTCVFATEGDITNVITTENEIVEEIVIDPVILTYQEAVEGIIQTLNKRDSYFFEIKNPNDYIQYVKDLGLTVPKDVNQGMTRSEFAVLVSILTERVTKEKNYSTDLIDINNVFTDISELSDEEKNAIKVVFIEGLMGGKKNDIFAPDEFMTDNSMTFVLERLEKGYTREKLFSILDSCFTKDEKEKILEKYGYFSVEVEENNEMLNDIDNTIEEDTEVLEKEEMVIIPTLEEVDIVLTKGALVELMVKLEEDTLYETTDLAAPVLFKDVIDYFNVLWKTSGTLFNTSNNEYHYLANDTSFLSNEEWEYLNSHLNSEVKVSEFLILYDRVKKLENDMLKLGFFDSWEEILDYTKNYLGFVYPLIQGNKDCFNYFLDLDNISENSKIKSTDFARAIHECQHEEFLTIAKASFSRGKSAGPWGTWSINPHRDPKMFYYYDYINSVWADSEMNTELPATNIMFEHYPEEIKKDGQISHYGTGEDSSSNSLGIQGLLSEFCSFAVESKVQAVSFSLGLNNATFGSIDYDSYRKQELMVKDYIFSLRELNSELYESFMADSDVIRVINNIFKDMDNIEKLYPWSMKHYTDVKLLDWEQEILLKK